MKKSELKKLVKALPPKWSETISLKTGYSIIHVSSVLYGRRNNDIIIKAAIELAEQYKNEKISASEKIKFL